MMMATIVYCMQRTNTCQAARRTLVVGLPALVFAAVLFFV